VGSSDYYRQTDWLADLRVRGRWSVVVLFVDGGVNGGSGEFAEIDRPRQGVAGWGTPQTRAERRVGALNEFRFDPEWMLSFRVDELEPGRHVAWTAVQVPPDWKGTRISFDITPNGDSVNLRFSQTGFPPDYEQLGFFNCQWALYMRRLKLLVGTGQGEPFGSAAQNLARW
jgi:uncharacterized protein YndB with AHSA1/START domain